jgi:heme/copper-type cytochrome/quinol oxidase subunit 4
MLEGFLLGVIVTASIVAAAFFWKFWRQTRDALFLAFAAAFLVEGLNRLSFLFIDSPNEGRPAIYAVRLIAFLLILAAIVRKNWGAR